MKIIKDIIDGKERAFYNYSDTSFVNIQITGDEDGESAFKECYNIIVEESLLDLRYPFWHDTLLSINNCKLTEKCRAALWYSTKITMIDTIVQGVKVFRECSDIKISDAKITSPEPFWFCRGVNIKDSYVEGEYAFFKGENIEISNLDFKGKYSFQYVKNLTITDSVLNTKDAFWHAENVTVINSTIRGEYLGWYAKNLKFVNCTIIGTQPLCYTDGVVLENCEMIDTDFSFEYSKVEADIKGEILSVKNPYKGIIKADSIKDIIIDENSKTDSNVEIIVNKKVA
jgi:hypothetical protein